MSDTPTPVPPAPTLAQQASPPNPTLRDNIISSARSLPELIATAEQLDPAMANKLKGGQTASTATPVGSLVGALIGFAATKYGLGWDDSTVNAVSGATLLAGGYVAHWFQARATSIVQTKP